MAGELRIVFLLLTLSPLSTLASCSKADRNGLRTHHRQPGRFGGQEHTLVKGATAEESGDLCLCHCVPVSRGPSFPCLLSRGNITHLLDFYVLLLLSVAKNPPEAF